uniref:Uncharacterized protein n=1 Tax=Oryza brachyantha TaxID=4533 RepID=J3MKF8_ORYBR
MLYALLMRLISLHRNHLSGCHCLFMCNLYYIFGSVFVQHVADGLNSIAFFF